MVRDVWFDCGQTFLNILLVNVNIDWLNILSIARQH